MTCLCCSASCGCWISGNVKELNVPLFDTNLPIEFNLSSKTPRELVPGAVPSSSLEDGQEALAAYQNLG